MPAGLRREEPKKFLDASLVPLENALLYRADELEAKPVIRIDGDTMVAVRLAIAIELRELAEELHHW